MSMSNAPVSQPSTPTAALAIAGGTPPQSTALAMAPSRFALEPLDHQAAWMFSERMARIRFCKVATPEEALARIMYGRILGLSAVVSLANVFIIEDRPGVDSTTLLGLCLERRDVCEQFECTETTAQKATFIAKRVGGKSQSLTWTIEQAKAAGLAQKDNWKNYPDAMLRARCISALARMVFPDIVKGFASVEELRDRDEARTVTITTDGEVIAEGGKPVGPAAETMLAELRAQIVACTTKEDFKAAREKIEAFPIHSDLPGLRDLYKETLKARKEAAAAAAQAQGATAPTEPAPAQTSEEAKS